MLMSTLLYCGVGANLNGTSGMRWCVWSAVGSLSHFVCHDVMRSLNAATLMLDAGMVDDIVSRSTADLAASLALASASSLPLRPA